MPDVEDIAIALGPLWVIDRRLTYHTEKEKDRLLDGLTYDREGTVEIDGMEDLPMCQPLTISDQEGWAPGGGGTLGTPIMVSTAFQLLVAAKREYGLFRRDPTAIISGDDANYMGVGVLEWVNKIRDAVERKVDGTDAVDALLEGSISKPVLTTVRDMPVTDLAWTMLIEFRIDIESICRGARSYVP